MKPTDTSKNFHHHAHMLFGRDPGGIEAMEKRGQEELVQSDVLPTERLGKHKWLLERWGFKIGAVVKDDPLFTEVTLPAGWTKKATDHGMWSKVVDEQGRERVSVFYKAAFYDRRAHVMVEPRYVVDYDTASVLDRKTGATLFTAEPVVPDSDGDEWTVRGDRIREARKWADDNGIDRDDPAAWDEP